MWSTSRVNSRGYLREAGEARSAPTQPRLTQPCLTRPLGHPLLTSHDHVLILVTVLPLLSSISHGPPSRLKERAPLRASLAPAASTLRALVALGPRAPHELGCHAF